MSRIFNFSALFARFGVNFSRLPSNKGGGYRDYDNGGQWVPGPDLAPEQMSGIVLQLTNDDLRMDVQGTFQRQDVKVYIQPPHELNTDDRLLIRGKEYRILEERLYSPEYADFDIFVARRTTIKDGAQ